MKEMLGEPIDPGCGSHRKIRSAAQPASTLGWEIEFTM
ncbi:hypothetical protein PATSB16_06890 [Pandoraea thiooxydans]|nr:hypothetical protein PATSB16_06890 [Pandoraea thiooxydans]